MRKFFLKCMPLFLIIGCTKVPEEPNLPAPSNLTIKAIDKGLGLKLEWDEVPDADGYYIYFVKVRADGCEDTTRFCKVLVPYFCDEPGETNFPKIEDRGCGNYLVIPVRTIYDKGYVGESALISSRPTVCKSQIIYERNVKEPNAYGWDEEGNGTTYSITDKVNEWDFYLSDQDSSAGMNATLLHFLSPIATIGPNPRPDVEWDTTWLCGPTVLEVAPEKIPYTFVPNRFDEGIKQDEIYYFLVDSLYYVKIEVKSILSDGIEFDSYFQKIKGFRRFD